MTSGECLTNKWLCMKYIGKYLSVEILLISECSSRYFHLGNRGWSQKKIWKRTIQEYNSAYMKKYKNETRERVKL
jgi:hypothetical protein